MLLVWSVSIYSIYQYTKEQNSSGGNSQVTVLVHGEKGKDNLVLTNRGKVKLLYGDASIEETINSKGEEATFKQIPPSFFDKDATVEILFFDPEGEPYKTSVPDLLYILTKGKYISLAVSLFGLGELVGIVKDFETGDPLEGVRISIIGAEAFSNEHGEYKLVIPEELQRKFQTIRASKEGFEAFELSQVPVQTDSELPILMKAKIEE